MAFCISAEPVHFEPQLLEPLTEAQFANEPIHVVDAEVVTMDEQPIDDTPRLKNSLRRIFDSCRSEYADHSYRESPAFDNLFKLVNRRTTNMLRNPAAASEIRQCRASLRKFKRAIRSTFDVSFDVDSALAACPGTLREMVDELTKCRKIASETHYKIAASYCNKIKRGRPLTLNVVRKNYTKDLRTRFADDINRFHVLSREFLTQVLKSNGETFDNCISLLPLVVLDNTVQTYNSAGYCWSKAKNIDAFAKHRARKFEKRVSRTTYYKMFDTIAQYLIDNRLVDGASDRLNKVTESHERHIDTLLAEISANTRTSRQIADMPRLSIKRSCPSSDDQNPRKRR